MRFLYRLAFLLAAGLLCATHANAQASTVYEDEAAFLAAVDTPTLIDFEGIAAPGESLFLSNPGVFISDGVSIISNSQMFVQNIDASYGTGSFLSPQGTNPQVVQIILPANTIAFGFSYSYANYAGLSATANVGGSGGFDMPPEPPGSMGFFGVTKDVAIGVVTVIVDGGAIDIDNIWFAVDPSLPPVGITLSEAVFLNAVSSPSLIDFEGVATVPDESVFFGDPGVFEDQGVFFSNSAPLWVRNIDGLYGSGSFLESSGGESQNVQILLPPNTIAVGFSYSYTNWGSVSASVSIGGAGAFFLPPEPPGELGFFGVVRDTAIDVVTVTVNGAVVDIDNVWFLVDPNAPPPEIFRDEAAFLGLLNSPTLTDFEGIAPPGDSEYLGAPGLFVENGLTISNNWHMYAINDDRIYGTGAYLQATGENPAVVQFELPANALAVGFSYSYAVLGATSATVNVDGSGGFVLPPEPLGSMGFFGVIRETPIGVVTVTVDGPTLEIDNVWIFVDPGAPPPEFYRNESAFLAEVQSPTIIDFEGIVDPGESTDFGDPGAFVESGVRIANETKMFVQNNTWYGTLSYLSAQGATPQSVLIQLPPDTLAVGFSYNSEPGTVTINGSEVFNLNAQYFNQLGFFGVVRDTPIESITIATSDVGIDFDNVWIVRALGSGAQFNVPGGGDIDTSFGTNGVLMLDDLLQSDATTFFGLGVQPDGGIILAGIKANDFQDPVTTVAKIDLTGALDPTFGDGGIRTVYLGPNGGDVSDMKVLADGAILVVGRGDIGTADSTSFIFKLDADGDLDTTFGFNGIVTENLDPPPDFPTDKFERVVVRDNGSILLGTVGLGVHQFSASGLRDMSFGVSGVAVPQDDAWANFGLAVAGDGTIVFGGGTTFWSGPQNFIVGSYLADGSGLSSSFGSNGIASANAGAENDQLLDLVIDDQERIVAVGFTEQAGLNPFKTAVVRFLPNGQLDQSFGYGGIRLLDGIALRHIYVTRVVPRPDGGLLLIGRATASRPFLDQEIFVMSLHEDGTLDESFAGRGWQEFDVIPDPEDGTLSLRRAALTIHPSGKLILMNWKCYCVAMLEAPQWRDTDGDGLSDGIDPDDDNDGVLDVDDAFPLDATESVDTDNDGIGDNADTDDDGDGIPDDYELANGLDPLNPADAAEDPDGDGFTNLEEFEAGTDPQNVDDFPAARMAPVSIFILLDDEG